MKYIDKDAVLENCNTRELVDYLGIEVRRKGSKDSILCLSHDDRHFGSCFLTEYGYYCFACQTSVNHISMVMQYTGCTYREALEIIVESFGGDIRDYYYDDNYTDSVEFQRRMAYRSLPLSKEERIFLGLNEQLNYNKKYHPIQQSLDFIPKIAQKEVSILSEDGCLEKRFLTLEKPTLINLATLYQDEPEVYRELVQNKAKETTIKYLTLANLFGSRDAPYAYIVCLLYEKINIPFDDSFYTFFYNDCMTKANKAYNIYQKHAA